VILGDIVRCSIGYYTIGYCTSIFANDGHSFFAVVLVCHDCPSSSYFICLLLKHVISNRLKKEREEHTMNRRDNDQAEETRKRVAMASASASSESSSDEEDDSSDSDDDGELDLDGINNVLVEGNPEDASSSSSGSEDSENDGDDDDRSNEKKQKPENHGSNKRKQNDTTKSEKKKKKKKKKPRSSGDDHDDDDEDYAASGSSSTIQVEFTFCELDEKFFHGIKSLVHHGGTVYQKYASRFADCMTSSSSSSAAAVGTVVSTDGDVDNTAYGFAAVLGYRQQKEEYRDAMQFLVDACGLNTDDEKKKKKNGGSGGCPAEYRKKMERALLSQVDSGEEEGGGKSHKKKKHKRGNSSSNDNNCGFLLHGRMMNLPLEITLVLHQQLLLDMEWAVEQQRKQQTKTGSGEAVPDYDYSSIVRLAPCQRDKKNGHALVYKYFDDEVLAGRADVVYTVDAPKSYSKEDDQLLSVMLLTRQQHRDAIQDLERMIR